MKANIKSKVRNRGLVFRFSWCMLGVWFFLISLQNINAQTLTKVYEQTLDVSDNIIIHSKGTDFGLECHGSISMRTENEITHISDVAVQYANKTFTPRFIIARRAEFQTHDKNQVIYKTTVNVEGPDAQSLLDNLKFCLRESAIGTVKASHLLNIRKFLITNGWMRVDRNAVVLDNGTSYDITRFEIATEYVIPKSSNLILEGEGTNYEVGDLTGKLSAFLDYGSLNCKNINEIEMTFKEAEVNIKSVKNGIFNSHKSKLEVQSGNKITTDGYLSKINIHKVDSLKITNTSNDKFYIGEVQHIKAKSSFFSNYEIGKLHKSLNMKLVNGDLSIKQIQAGFDNIQLNNEVSTIRLGVEQLKNYSLTSSNVNKTEIEGLERNSFTDGKNGSKGDPSLGGKILLSCENCKVIFENW